MRGKVNRALVLEKKKKTVGKALEAQVTLYAVENLAQKLAQLGDELRFVLITSKVSLNVVTDVNQVPDNATGTEIEGLWLSVSAAEGAKCDRCWHVTTDVGTHDAHPELCGRCITNVDGEGEARKYA